MLDPPEALNSFLVKCPWYLICNTTKPLSNPAPDSFPSLEGDEGTAQGLHAVPAIPMNRPVAPLSQLPNPKSSMGAMLLGENLLVSVTQTCVTNNTVDKAIKLTNLGFYNGRTLNIL